MFPQTRLEEPQESQWWSTVFHLSTLFLLLSCLVRKRTLQILVHTHHVPLSFLKLCQCFSFVAQPQSTFVEPCAAEDLWMVSSLVWAVEWMSLWCSHWFFGENHFVELLVWSWRTGELLFLFYCTCQSVTACSPPTFHHRPSVVSGTTPSEPLWKHWECSSLGIWQRVPVDDTPVNIWRRLNIWSASGPLCSCSTMVGPSGEKKWHHQWEVDIRLGTTEERKEKHQIWGVAGCSSPTHVLHSSELLPTVIRWCTCSTTRLATGDIRKCWNSSGSHYYLLLCKDNKRLWCSSNALQEQSRRLFH